VIEANAQRPSSAVVVRPRATPVHMAAGRIRHSRALLRRSGRSQGSLNQERPSVAETPQLRWARTRRCSQQFIEFRSHGSLNSTTAAQLLSLSRVSAGGRSRVFQRTKSLTHVAEFTQRRVELARLGRSRRCLVRRTPAAAPEVQDDNYSSDDKQDEGRYHFECAGPAP
jgi:hypothetical protein